ncbi:hypothetical protein [Streptomyces arboris]|uniref:hypothetical protein n=1 Tax=Streptomyces arboris TaxID=2600619 RepID=UPI003BF54B2B
MTDLILSILGAPLQAAVVLLLLGAAVALAVIPSFLAKGIGAALSGLVTLLIPSRRRRWQARRAEKKAEVVKSIQRREFLRLDAPQYQADKAELGLDEAFTRQLARRAQWQADRR